MLNKKSYLNINTIYQYIWYDKLIKSNYIFNDISYSLKEYELNPKEFNKRRSGSTSDFDMYGILDTPNAKQLKEGTFFEYDDSGKLISNDAYKEGVRLKRPLI